MSAMDAYWAAPPVTRTLTAAVVLLSVTVYAGLLNGYYVVFIRQAIWRLPFPQLWRLVTPFLLTGPKLSLILDPYFLWTYSKPLETEAAAFSQPGDYLVFLVFVCLVILLTGGFVLQSVVLLAPLTLALTYMFAQDNPSRRVSLFIITIQAKYLPYALLALTFVASSPEAALHQATGLLAAHLYEFLTRIWPTFGGGQSIIKTPQTVKKWFMTPVGAGTARSYGTAFRTQDAAGQQAAPVGRSGGWTSAFSPGTWGGRGPGRRLGGT